MSIAALEHDSYLNSTSRSLAQRQSLSGHHYAVEVRFWRIMLEQLADSARNTE